MALFTHTVCPLCGGNHLQREMKVTDHSNSKEDFELYRCSTCSFLFTQNAPAAEEIGPYYQSENYISHSDTKEGFVNKAYHMVRDFMLGRKYTLVKKLSTGKRLLDMGCGTGYFPNYMKNKGFDVKGVEIDSGARKFGIEKFGLDIVPPETVLNQSYAETYDVITLWHVLEHIYDLDGYMQRLKSLLDDKGYLVIAVPNSDSLDAKQYKSYWAAYDVPIHLWHFTPKTLTQLAEKHGFEVTDISSLPFDPFYISMLSSKYKKSALSVIRGAFVGGLSFLNALVNTKKASSPIYILKKK
ncbi:MAG: class I SAM-dependent methyltransferase [Bacteroidia bacterium]|nr:class I SAM-dependent methyltransferase [Bacteroidia bacterium]